MFEVCVPMASAGAAEAAESRLAPLLDGRLILLIDDDPMVLKSMASLLTAYNCRVLSCGSLPDAEVAVGECLRLPDLIISDHHLGGGRTGVQAVRRIRELAQEDIPALLVTADRSSSLDVAIEGVPVLSKPLQVEALAAALCRLPEYAAEPDIRTDAPSTPDRRRCA